MRIRGVERLFFLKPCLKEKSYFIYQSGSRDRLKRRLGLAKGCHLSHQPKNVSSNLVLEKPTASGFFGQRTPLHLHDKDHLVMESQAWRGLLPRFSWKKGRRSIGLWVQLLMDGKKMMKVFSLWQKYFRYSGAVTLWSPRLYLNSLFVGLAGKGSVDDEDHPEFVHLKSFEEFFKEWEGQS